MGVRRRLRWAAYRRGLPPTVTVDLGRPVTFHRVGRSNLLLIVAVDGLDAFESEVLAWTTRYPWPIHTFVDGGANIGLFSAAMAVSRPEVETVAVEPHPANVAYLRRLRDRNKLRFDIEDRALHEVDGESVALDWPTKRSSSRLPSSAHITMGSGRAQASTVTLSKLMEGRPLPALVKLDLEGSELAVLRGAKDWLERDGVDLIVEMLLVNDGRHELFGMLSDLGYQGWLLTTSGLVETNRPLVIPHPELRNKPAWRNHWFTRRPADDVRAASKQVFGGHI